MIGIVDYGLGNLTSVAGAVEKVGFEPLITSDPAKLRQADRLILPGVGAFGDGMAKLRERGLVDVLGDLVRKQGRPLLGICLGAQLLAKQSEEFGIHQGLGWVDAEVVRLAPSDPTARIPHVGWNEVIQVRDCVLWKEIPDRALFYFVHSFRIKLADPSGVAGECDYGGRFAAVLQSGNLYATQFHPEKSQRHGLTMLRNFLTEG